MIVSRFFRRSWAGRSDRTPATASKVCSDQHARSNITVSRADASLDTEVLLQKFVNYEQQGVPDSAGTSGNKVFDLVRPSHSPARQTCLLYSSVPAAWQVALHKLMAALGQPQANMSAVHIAGTKGKGSTASLLASVLTQSQICTGLYTR